MRRRKLEALLVAADERHRLYELLATKRHGDLLAKVEGVHKDVRSLRVKVDRDFKPTKKAS